MSTYTLKRTLVGRLQQGTDLYDGITRILVDNSIRLGRITGIGAVQNAAVAYYDQKTGKYQEIILEQPMEILTLSGNVSMKEGKPFAHIHVVLSDAQGRAQGGHLLPGRSPVFACEVIVEEFHGPALNREADPATGLALWPTSATL